MVVPLVALVVGAGVATGAYALIDDGNITTAPSKVIVVDKPGPHAAEIPGKNEAATAAAISPSTSAISPQSGTDIPGKNEAATAVAISPQTGAVSRGHDESTTAAAISQSNGVELRGSKASSAGTSSEDAATARRTDPHGPASALRSP